MNKGEDVFVNKDVFIKDSNCTIGSHVAIDKGFYCTTRLVIGNYVHVGPYTAVIGGLGSKVTMKDFSFMSVRCNVIAGSDNFNESNLMGPLIPDNVKSITTTEVVFEKFSGLAANCTVLPGITLGEGSIVCAGSTVTKNTKPWTIYAGSPARPIGKRDKERVIKQEKMLKEVME